LVTYTVSVSDVNTVARPKLAAHGGTLGADLSITEGAAGTNGAPRGRERCRLATGAHLTERVPASGAQVTIEPGDCEEHDNLKSEH
jgi:hypothetical protein